MVSRLRLPFLRVCSKYAGWVSLNYHLFNIADLFSQLNLQSRREYHILFNILLQSFRLSTSTRHNVLHLPE